DRLFCVVGSSALLEEKRTPQRGGPGPLRKLTVLLLSGWLGWIDVAQWDKAGDLKADPQPVQISTQAASDQDVQPSAPQENRKPELRDILLGPQAPSWREIRRESIR